MLGPGLVGGSAAGWEKRQALPLPAPGRETRRYLVLHLLRGGIIHPEGLHGHGLDALILQRLIHVVPLGIHDGIGHLHALDDLAERGILAVQMGSLLHHDEELAAGGVGAHGAGHGQHAPVMLQVVLEAVAGELTLDGIARAAHTGALGATALDHEAGDHPVEDQPVIEAGLDQAHKVVDRIGGHLGIELGHHLAAVLHLDGHDGILSHGKTLLSNQGLKVPCAALSMSITAAVLPGPVHLPFGVPGCCGVPLVVELLALAQAHLQLDARALEIDRQRHQSVAVLLHLGEKPQDLPLVHEQPAGPQGVPVEDIALFIGAYVHAVDHHLSVLDDAEGVLQVHIAHADGLDLGAAQLDAGLVFVLHEVVMIGLPIGGDELDWGVIHGCASFLRAGR